MSDPIYHFTVTPEQMLKVNAWLAEVVYPLAIKEQKKDKTFKHNRTAWDAWDNGFPYGGAIGGGVTYKFTPNSIGCSVFVEECYTSKKLTLDISDYDSW